MGGMGLGALCGGLSVTRVGAPTMPPRARGGRAELEGRVLGDRPGMTPLTKAALGSLISRLIVLVLGSIGV